MKKGYVKISVLIFVIIGLVMPIKGWLGGGKQPTAERSLQIAQETSRPPLPPAFALRLKGDNSTGPRVTMKAEYLPDGDIQLSCVYNHSGIEAYHTLRWNPTSTEPVNGQWTRTEYHQKKGWFGKVETTTSQFAGKAIVAKLPDRDRWSFILYEPDKDDPSKDVVVSLDQGGGRGSLMPVW